MEDVSGRARKVNECNGGRDKIRPRSLKVEEEAGGEALLVRWAVRAARTRTRFQKVNMQVGISFT